MSRIASRAALNACRVVNTLFSHVNKHLTPTNWFHNSSSAPFLSVTVALLQTNPAYVGTADFFSTTSRQLTDMSNGEPASSKFKIYTKTGDKGTAALYNGQRRAKDDDVFHALGDVDELNSAIGVAQDYCTLDQQDLQQQLQVIMSRLLDVGSAVATPADSSSEHKLARVRFPQQATDQLESWLDAMDDQLPALKNFILPSGGKASAHLHMARAVCRRAERSVVPLVRAEVVDTEVGVYLNRLSDYLFTAARFAAQCEGKPEIVYKKA